MHYKKLLILSASVILLAGCGTTYTQHSSTPQAAKKGDVKHVAPDGTVNVVKARPSTDMSATYSTATGDGTMTQASVSAPVGQEASAAASPAATAPSASKATSTQQGASLATGFSLDMPYDDAWPKVRKALPAAGYSVMEKDDLTGTYYVLDKVGSGGKIERDTPIYQVRLTKAGDASTKVILLDSASQPASSGVSNRILGALKNKLD